MEVFSVFATLSLVDLISGPLGKVQGALRGAEAGVKSFGRTMGELTMSMAPVALGAGMILGALSLLATSGIATEKALAELATLGVKDLAAVEEAARQASNSMAGLTKDQFITAAYDIKSGISSLSDEGVAAFTTLAAKTAQATKATVADMTNLGATAYGIHKRMYADLSDADFGSMLYAGVASSVQAFKTTGAAMNQAMSNLGAAATLANRPLEEQFAVLGSLQNSMESSVAGTAYKSFFRDASRGFTALGIKATDASGQMRAMPDLLEELENKLGTLDQMKLDSIIKGFGAESGALVQNLIGKSDELRKSIATVGTAMQGGTGFLDEMAASMNAGLGPTTALLSQRFKNLREELAKHLTPTLTTFAAGVSRLVLRLQDLAKSPIVGFLLKAAAAISAALLALTALSAALWFASSIVGMLAKALAPLKAVLLGLSAPFLVVIAVIGALYAAYKTNFGGMADTLNRWWNTISLVVRGVIALFQNLTGSTGEIRGELATEIKAAGLEGLVTTVARAVYRIKEFFAGIADALDFGPALAVLTPALTRLFDLFSTVGNAIGDMFSLEIKGASSEARSFGQLVGGFLNWVLEGLATMFANVARGVDTLFSLFAYFGALLRGDWATATALAQRMWDNFCISLMAFADFFRIGDWIRNAWAEAQAFIDGIDLYESGKALLLTFADGIASAVMAPVNALGGALASMRDFLPFSDAKTGPLSTLTLSGTRMMTTLADGVLAGAGTLLQSVTGALGSVGESLSGWWDGLFGGTATPTGPTPNIPAPETLAENARADAARSPSSERGQTTITIHIASISLPGVTDGQNFVGALQGELAGYGVLS